MMIEALQIFCGCCGRIFGVCRDCYRGHKYCSDACRTAGYYQNRRKAQSNYRQTGKGKEQHSESEKRRRERKKTELKRSNENYYELLKKEANKDFISKRKVKIDYTLEKDRVIYKVKDDGKGFDWMKYLNETDESMDNQLLVDFHGLGLQMVKNSFDEVNFNDSGNEVTLVKYFNKPKNEQ